MQIELVILLFVSFVSCLFLFVAAFWMHVMLFGKKTLGTITQTPKETGHDYVIEFTTQAGEKRKVRDGGFLGGVRRKGDKIMVAYRESNKLASIVYTPGAVLPYLTVAIVGVVMIVGMAIWAYNLVR